MITVIIAGGSGTRLWPLSTHERPKQLIKLLDGVSPLQEAYGRAKRLTDEVYVLPEARLIEDIQGQLPHLDADHLIVEPGLRGTASCYLLALDAITRKHSLTADCVYMGDHHVHDVDG
jgi:mannose-1-phosphate guanylyltransferase